MSLKDIKKQLNELSSIKMDKETSCEMRSFLMSKVEKDVIEGSVVKNRAFSFVSTFVPSVRAIIVSLVVILIPGGGFTTVKAAFSSLPGDFLYPVKITTEKIQVAFADKEEKALLRFELARRRLDEAEEIINKEENGEKKVRVALAVEKFKEEIENITNDMEGLEDGSQKELEDKIAILNTEVAKYVDVTEVNTEEEDIDEEVIGLVDNILSDDVAKNIASTTIMIAKPVVEEAEEDPESFKIQLQIIEN